MGVDVDAVLFVGVKERDLPKKALKKLASLEVYDEYKNDENLFEDESLSSWLEEYVKQPVAGISSQLSAVRNSEYASNPIVLVGFEIAMSGGVDEVDADEIGKQLEAAVQEFQYFFGFAPKVYLFPRWY